MAIDSLDALKKAGANADEIIELVRIANRHNNEMQNALEKLKVKMIAITGDDTIDLPNVTAEQVQGYLDADLDIGIINSARAIIKTVEVDYMVIADHVSLLPPLDM